MFRSDPFVGHQKPFYGLGVWPNQFPSLAAWYRFGVGITSSNGLVSAWADQSGNGRHLLQATETNQPALQADGSILFDGTDNYLKADAFTLPQPTTVYLLVNPVSWAGNDVLSDGNGAGLMAILQRTSSPQVGLNAGAAMGNIAPTLGIYSIIIAVFNGASSLIQRNDGSAVTGNAGLATPGGFTLATQGNAAAGFSNIQVKEAIVYSAAHGDNVRLRIARYLSRLM